jgi:hypothetical protein
MMKFWKGKENHMYARNGPDIVIDDLDEDHRHRANDDVDSESFDRS